MRRTDAFASLMHKAALCIALMPVMTPVATAGDTPKPPSQYLVELTCTSAGVATLRTLSSMQIQPAWQSPTLARNEPVSMTRQVMRIRDHGGPNRPFWEAASFAHRMARCRAGKSDVVVRIAEDIPTIGYQDDSINGYARFWIDGKPSSLMILSLERLDAAIDTAKQTVSACSDHVPFVVSEDDEAQPKRLCDSKRFDLGAADELEFVSTRLVKGPNQDLVLTDAADAKLCADIGPHLDGGPFPTGYTEPPTAKAPETWEYANAAKTYRVDADNDGEIDDVAILEVDQHIYMGSVLAMFEKDTVLTGKIAPPWWADLLESSRGKRGGPYISKPLPAEFNWATNANDLGGYEAGSIELFVHEGVTYVRVNEWRSTHHHEEYLIDPPPPAALGTIRAKNFEQRIVKLTPDERAEALCTFVRRAETTY